MDSNISSNVDFILQESSNLRKEVLINQLTPKIRGGAVGGSTQNEIDEFCEPNFIYGDVRFNYTYSELKKMAHQYGYDKSEFLYLQFMIQAIQFCGIRIGDSSALKYVKRINGFEKGFRYPRIAGLLGTTRFTARITPNSWTGRFATNFVLYGSAIMIEGHHVGNLKAVFTASSIYNLAYITVNQNSEKILSINPFQQCAQNCRFCFKGSRAMNSEFKKTLINLKSHEMIRFLQCEYDSREFENLNDMVIFTARFSNKDTLLKYLKDIYYGVIDISRGKFNPMRYENQRIKVSTHLLDDADSMLEAKSYGVKRYIYPVEIFNDALRTRYMTSQYYKQGTNKGDVCISKVDKVLSQAKGIFGTSNVEPVVILGIDTYDDTKAGIAKIIEMGIKLLTYNVFRVYDTDQIEMYRMCFEEILDVEHYIKGNFERNFSQKITSSLPKYKEKYMEV